MTTIPQVARALREILTTTAAEAGRATRFVQRTSPSTLPPLLPCWGLHAGKTRSGRPGAHDHYQRGFVP